MKIKKIRAGLEKLIPALNAFGAQSIENDLKKLVTLLGDYDEMGVSEFCAKARSGLEQVQCETPPAGDTHHETIVRFYVDLLRETEFDDKAFNKTIVKLREDKKVRFKELSEIARQFNGYELRFKNRAAALTEITTKRSADRRTEHKFKMLSEW